MNFMRIIITKMLTPEGLVDVTRRVDTEFDATTLFVLMLCNYAIQRDTTDTALYRIHTNINKTILSV